MLITSKYKSLYLLIFIWNNSLVLSNESKADMSHFMTKIDHGRFEWFHILINMAEQAWA